MKKLLLIISTMYLTGCSVAKPVVLSAPLQQIKAIKHNLSGDTLRNGTNDFEIVKFYSTAVFEQNTRLEMYFEIYITPYNNPAHLSYTEDDRSSSIEGGYKSFDTSLFFDTKASLRLHYYDFKNSQTLEQILLTTNMQRSTTGADQRVFKTYRLPYDTASWIGNNGSSIYSYVYANTLHCFLRPAGNNEDYITINPYNYEFREYRNVLINSQIYYYLTAVVNMQDRLPTIPGEDNTNKLSQLYYNDLYTVGCMNINWWNELDNTTYIKNYKQEIRDGALNFFFGSSSLEEGYLDYQYNASLSQELTAYQTGYNDGLQEGKDGVGTSWIRQVFRAIQAFLDFDFGFFKLGHLLGGILVIAIVVFVVRWFR